MEIYGVKIAMQYKAVIIGCGRIGASFDSPDSVNILTHAKAFTSHPKVWLVAVMDIDQKIAKAAGDKWKCEYYTDFHQMIREQQPDIVSVCVPDQFHYEYFLQCLDIQPKAVVAEKPLTLNIKETQTIVEKYKNANIPLFVNYTRRYSSPIQSLKCRIETGDLGRIFNASIKYTKGILHNGSHAVDIANFLFGKFLSGNILNSIIDYSENDPTLSVVLQYAKCSEVFLIACDERAYSIFEIDIMAETGRIIFSQSGLRCSEYDVGMSAVFKGYKNLVLVKESDTDLNRSVFNLVDNVVQHLDNGEKIVCSGNDALSAQKICSDLIESWHRQKRLII